MHRDGNIKCRQIYYFDLNDSIKMLFMPCLDSEKNLCRSCSPGFRVGVFVRVRTHGRTLRLLHRLIRAWHQAHMNKQSLTACFFSICPFHCWYLDRWHDVPDTQVFPLGERKDPRKVLRDSKMCPPARVSWSYILDKMCHI